MFLFWGLIGLSTYMAALFADANYTNYPLASFLLSITTFAWFLTDTREYGYKVSWILKLMVILLPPIAVLYYLFKYKGFKRTLLSIVKFFGFLFVYLLFLYVLAAEMSSSTDSIEGKAIVETGIEEVDVAQMEVLAGDGSIYHQTNLGWIYYVGDGVERNYEKAIYWTKMAADEGFHYAINNLAVFYDEGKAFEEDDQKAFELYLKAAKLGLERAQSNVGEHYYRGDIVQQDYSEAFDWFIKAATQGNDTAKYFVARLYMEGKGIERNTFKAMSWAYRIDYDELRTTYVNSTFYDPTEIELSANFTRIFSSLESHDLMDVIFNINQVLDRDHLNPLAMTVAKQVYQDLEDTPAKEFYEYLYSETMKSILSSGDGRDVESAFKVVSKGEQTALLRMLGYEHLESRIFMEDGKAINAWRVKHSIEDWAVFFDISYFLQTRDMEVIMSSSSI